MRAGPTKLTLTEALTTILVGSARIFLINAGSADFQRLVHLNGGPGKSLRAGYRGMWQITWNFFGIQRKTAQMRAFAARKCASDNLNFKHFQGWTRGLRRSPSGTPEPWRASMFGSLFTGAFASRHSAGHGIAAASAPYFQSRDWPGMLSCQTGSLFKDGPAPGRQSPSPKTPRPHYHS